MKGIFIKTLLLSVIIFLTSGEKVFGNGSSADEFIVGRIEYTGKNGKEGIVVLNPTEKGYLLNKGVLLLVKRGNEKIILKIDDNCGKYIKCSVESGTGTGVMKEGEVVHYSESVNIGVKYRDAKKILAELITLYEDFILKIESTEEPYLIADAVKKFSARLDKLIPEMKRINSRYPELEKFNVEPPEELRDESVKLGILEPRLRDAFYKIKIFSSDENVKKATEELQVILSKMKSGR